MKQNNHYDVIVVGGGASGLMTAITAGQKGKRALILEKNNELGKKLKITGGGRCNVTNAEFDTPTLLGFYGNAKKYLFSPFAQFGVQDTFDFFQKNGLDLIVEEKKRAFPCTHKAYDVYRVFEKLVAQYDIAVYLGDQVVSWDFDNHHIHKVTTSKGTYTADNYVVATGGLSHPETGSTGDGFSWMKSFGHKIEESSPDIVPVYSDTPWIPKSAGVSFQNIGMTILVDQVKQIKTRGDVLCTHRGLSGPGILNHARYVKQYLSWGDVVISLDLFPDITITDLEKNILQLFEEHKNKDVKNVYELLVPPIFARATFFELGISPETKVHSVTAVERKKLVSFLKNIPVHISGLAGYQHAVVSDGGVILDEIDMRTMRSKKIDNLLVTGDMLHINRPSGGYSLQLCWTTGYVAGSNV